MAHGAAEADDGFGLTLVVGDLNDDGYDDLIAGVPFEDIGDIKDAGGLNILYGSSEGLSTAGSQWFDQNTPGMAHGAAETGDRFGDAFAVGDLNDDGHVDLAAGAPGEAIGTTKYAGGVNVLFGSPEGLSTLGSLWFDQNTPGMPDTLAEYLDGFGFALAIWSPRTYSIFLPLVKRP
jgi:hypothetical protein